MEEKHEREDIDLFDELPADTWDDLLVGFKVMLQKAIKKNFLDKIPTNSRNDFHVTFNSRYKKGLFEVSFKFYQKEETIPWEIPSEANIPISEEMAEAIRKKQEQH